MARIRVHIFDELGDGTPPAEWIARAADCALSAAEPGRADDDDDDESAALSVALADDETVAALNETHRGVEGTTDVLSFSNVHFGEYYGADARANADPDEFVLPPGYDADIGELVISYPQTLRQAAESGRDAREELAALLAHGALHLLGYDHEDERDAALMRERERAARNAQRRAGLFD